MRLTGLINRGSVITISGEAIILWWYGDRSSNDCGLCFLGNLFIYSCIICKSSNMVRIRWHQVNQYTCQFIPIIDAKGTQWVPLDLICMYVFSYWSLSIRLSIFLSWTFWWSNHAARNCVQYMKLQTMGSNPLSGSIICPSVSMSSIMPAFCDYCICINFQCGGPERRCIYLKTYEKTTVFIL